MFKIALALGAIALTGGGIAVTQTGSTGKAETTPAVVQQAPAAEVKLASVDMDTAKVTNTAAKAGPRTCVEGEKGCATLSSFGSGQLTFGEWAEYLILRENVKAATAQEFIEQNGWQPYVSQNVELGVRYKITSI